MRRGGRPDRRPELALQLRRIGVDPPELGAIAGRVEQDALIEILSQQLAYSRRFGSGQQVGPDILRPDGVGLRLLLGLALIVTADGH